ncbi:hypothetical protein LY28_00457 [Ruminiclostridium sufflavum DSM 19573]|uniref:Uncharacterized protein n=1 Tax=Ruminiclostridium sufflavum DSM 19573 TaxID=1121337 RepID=A0A318XTP3_9FIRM|nr:hypothetical protein [Ruminiclostridium sufflavum]PYG89859.1 hypothetical protein LY28_00457 [Ruminiclostridium sufflavum DSM 19573]
MDGCCNTCGCNDNICHLLAKYIGQTVTIFTKSGGQSGCGFTGVILGVNECYCRLITSIGPAPGCALGNGCGNMNMNDNSMSGCDHMQGYGYNCQFNQYGQNSGTPVYNVGSVTDIPINSIASFVHNAI